jgi:hypothetical protein
VRRGALRDCASTCRPRRQAGLDGGRPQATAGSTMTVFICISLPLIDAVMVPILGRQKKMHTNMSGIQYRIHGRCFRSSRID